MQHVIIRLKAGVCPDWMRILHARVIAAVETLSVESGQDLIEYALVAALIALAATVSMRSVATAISTAFTNVSTHIGTYTS